MHPQPAPAAGSDFIVMRHQHQSRPALGIDGKHQIDDLVPGSRIEIAGRLVGKNQFGAGREGAGQRHALLLAPREMLGVVTKAVRKPHALKPSARLAARRTLPRQLKRQHDVFQRRQRRQQLKRLKNKTEYLAAQDGTRIFIKSVDFPTVEKNTAGTGLIEPGQQAKQGRLTRAGSTDDGHGFTGGDGEGNLVQNDERRLTTADAALHLLVQIFDLHHDRFFHHAMLSVISIRRSLQILLAAAMFLLAPAAHAAKTILVFGDSLSAGFGIRQDAAWPALLQQRLSEKRLDYSVVNASISGETSSGGRARISEALARHKPAVLVLALGANDGLRGLPLAGLRDNLSGIVRAARATKARILIVGMQLPPNYGGYADEFRQVFKDVAKKEGVPLIPFLLDGIAEKPQFFQADALHPTAEAQAHLLDNVWGGLVPLLK